MSGIEVAGLVLGAFPLAIVALEKYREVADRLQLFRHIQLKYTKVLYELKFHQIDFTFHMRQLLLPLVVDDDQIKTLIADPGGPGWKDPHVAEFLERRLQGSFPLYIKCIQELQRVMQDIQHELAFDSETVQDSIPDPTSSNRKEKLVFWRYKLKFSNRESVRQRLFHELQDYNSRLGKLLDLSDKDTQLVQERNAALQTASIDAALCKFSIQARKVWKALSTAWNCQCAQHEAKLLLQHRTSKRFEVLVIFTKSSPVPSQWGMYKTRIAEGDKITNVVGILKEKSPRLLENTKIPARQNPHQWSSIPLPSTLKNTQGSNTMANTACFNTFANVQTTSSQPDITTQPISNLCAALERPEGLCCGYLAEEDPDCRYYVYTIQRQREAKSMISSVSLAEILRGQVLPKPTRTQRYVISLILASSFLQLLDSPWMPASFRKMDISFFRDPNGKNTNKQSVFSLDQPYITRRLLTAAEKNDAPITTTTTTKTKIPHFAEALDDLGILLIELCFGCPLEDQKFRQDWPSGSTTREKALFDVMAAREWQCHVNEEAGMDYSEAVSWCLGGNRSAKPEKWRHEMLQRVVQPLQRCRDYLMGEGGTGISV